MIMIEFPIPKSWLSTDGTFAGNSDVLVPSQKAVKTYVDNAVLQQSSFSSASAAMATRPTFYAVTVGSSYSKALAASASVADGVIISLRLVSLTAGQTLTITRDGSDVIRHCGASLTSFVLDKPDAELMLRKRGSGWDVIYVKGRQTQQVILTTPGATTAGYGTSRTQIRRLTVTHTQIGTAITPTTTTANGSEFALNEFGPYDVIVSDGQGTATECNIGLTVNTTEYTTVVETTTLAKRLMSRIAPYITQNAVQHVAAVGDVLRAHMGFVKPNITTSDGFISITKAGE